VSDPGVASPPGVVRWSIWINVAILISNPIIGAFDHTLIPAGYQAGVIVGIVIGAMVSVLFAVLLYQIYRRRNWARIVFALLTIVGLLAFTPFVVYEIPTSINGALSTLSSIASLATVVMVFTPAANRWFRDRRDAFLPQ
jgi:hypothetical protein